MFRWVGTKGGQLFSMTCIYWQIYLRVLYRQSFWIFGSVQSIWGSFRTPLLLALGQVTHS